MGVNFRKELIFSLILIILFYLQAKINYSFTLVEVVKQFLIYI